MKIGILTFQRACNYGAVLQAYALRTFLKRKMGADIEIVDYRNLQIEREYAVTKFSLEGNILKEAAASMLCAPYRIRRNNAFKRFRQDCLNIKGQGINKQALRALNETYDIFIVGSDQVWNMEITGNDESYFLDFVNDEKKRCSYAASIGKSKFSENQRAELLLRLKGFSAVSFRESEAASEFQPMLPDKRLYSHLDPVYLLEADIWRQLSAAKPCLEPYILFFTTGNGPEIIPDVEFARKIAAERGMKALFLSDQDRWFKHRSLKHCGAVMPQEFLSLIDHAACVVTNSFHATSFSIMLHTPFYVETDLPRSGRLLNILRLFGMEDRQLKRGEPVCRIESAINWARADEEIRERREQSENYLSAIIQGEYA